MNRSGQFVFGQLVSCCVISYWQTSYERYRRNSEFGLDRYRWSFPGSFQKCMMVSECPYASNNGQLWDLIQNYPEWLPLFFLYDYQTKCPYCLYSISFSDSFAIFHNHFYQFILIHLKFPFSHPETPTQYGHQKLSTYSLSFDRTVAMAPES